MQTTTAAIALSLGLHVQREDYAATLMNYAAAPYRRHNDKSLVLVSNYIFTLLCNSPFGPCPEIMSRALLSCCKKPIIMDNCNCIDGYLMGKECFVDT